MSQNSPPEHVDTSKLSKFPLQKQLTLDLTLDKSSNSDSSVISTNSHSYSSRSYNGVANINFSSNDTWSLNTNSILIENLGYNRHNSAKFYLTNHSKSKQLSFFFVYQQNFLEIEPKSGGVVAPLKSIEFTVTSKRDVLSNLPWFGTLSISCNRINKDIRISLFSKTSVSTKNNQVSRFVFLNTFYIYFIQTKCKGSEPTRA